MRKCDFISHILHKIILIFKIMLKCYNISTNQILWSLDLPKEEAAGMLAISIPLFKKLNLKLLTEDDYADFMQREQILPDFTWTKPVKNYAICLKHDDIYYNVFTFETPTFIKGILRLCYSCNADFNDYVHQAIVDKKFRMYYPEGFRFSNDIKDAVVDLEDFDSEVDMDVYDNPKDAISDGEDYPYKYDLDDADGMA